MINPEFSHDLDILNETQRKAVDWGDGALLVLAGPGSGKTKIITTRIARILKESEGEKFRVLGLTFTNKAADEMRQRVNRYISLHEKRMLLGTFHSFCTHVLRQHGSHIGIKTDFKIYAQREDLQAVLDDAIQYLKSTTDISLNIEKKVLPVIEQLKSHCIFPEESLDVFKDKNVGKTFSLIYEAYENELERRNALDFNSLILRTYDLFVKFPAFAKRYQSVYKYIFVDEFQDTNLAQYKMLRSLTGDQHKNILVVADDDQIIYQWNGASHKRIEEYIKDYAPTVIQLPLNYRCPNEIVEIANNLIIHNFLRETSKQPLQAIRTSSRGQVIWIIKDLTDEQQEAETIAEDIKVRHKNNFGEVAVLARNNWLLTLVKEALDKINVPSIIYRRKDKFESTPYKWLSSILQLANDRQDSRYLEIVCGTFYQLTGVKIEQDAIIANASLTNRDYLRSWIEIMQLDDKNILINQAVEYVRRYLIDTTDYQHFCNEILQWFDRVVTEKKAIIGNELSPVEVFAEYEEETRIWRSLERDIRRSAGQNLRLDSFLQELQLRSKEPVYNPQKVSLMTIHGSKGKEFKHVYLIAMVETILPSYQSILKGDSSPELEEERRNCFVALTRAGETVTFSYAKRYKNYSKKPSRFLYEMGLID